MEQSKLIPHNPTFLSPKNYRILYLLNFRLTLTFASMVQLQSMRWCFDCLHMNTCLATFDCRPDGQDYFRTLNLNWLVICFQAYGFWWMVNGVLWIVNPNFQELYVLEFLGFECIMYLGCKMGWLQHCSLIMFCT